MMIDFTNTQTVLTHRERAGGAAMVDTDTFISALDALEISQQRIAELEAELAKTKEGLSIAVEAMVKRWIPCSEKLPDEGSEVLGTTFFGNVRIYDYFGKSWFSNGRSFDKPTHWMPIPQPPEVER
jgi:hypothetical protein